jgi:hypothetical protein
MLKLISLRKTPHWNPNDDQDHQRLEQYQEALLGA